MNALHEQVVGEALSILFIITSTNQTKAKEQNYHIETSRNSGCYVAGRCQRHLFWRPWRLSLVRVLDWFYDPF